jgi:hypothetical protein
MTIRVCERESKELERGYGERSVRNMPIRLAPTVSSLAYILLLHVRAMFDLPSAKRYD